MIHIDGAAQSGLIQPFISILIWWINNNLSLTPDANFSSYQYYLAKCSMWYHLELVIVSCTSPLQRVVTLYQWSSDQNIIALNMYPLIATSDLLSRVKFPPIKTSRIYRINTNSRRCISDVFIDRGGFLTMVQRYLFGYQRKWPTFIITALEGARRPLVCPLFHRNVTNVFFSL